jgi:hypothetical protein
MIKTEQRELAPRRRTIASASVLPARALVDEVTPAASADRWRSLLKRV